MKKLAIILSVLAVVCAVSAEAFAKEAPSKPPAATKPAAKDKLPKGFKRIFDGKTLKGWTGRKGPWKVEDGAIVGDTAFFKGKMKHNDFLYTDREYGDFELRLKFRLVNHNSGVQVRSRAHKDFRVTGYQADIAERRYTGILYEEGERGILADVDPKEVAKHVKKGKWNDYRIVCQGNRLRFWIHGHLTIDYTEKKKTAPKKGVIGLQLHGGPVMKVYFKDLILKELPKAAPKADDGQQK